ncbi:hypothetical protein [Winogradskyella sp. A3E31]|uniref:hypothetical protein n=1 Tax=Winogradskyella sp. A3E31 TaxID=3349637 RepID=UPI00398B5D06
MKHKIAIFFTILFMAIISAPTIIMSVDNSADISIFYSLNEEEETESFKLLFDKQEKSDHFVEMYSDDHSTGYTFKNYPKPHLNLVSPPPEFIM